MGTWAAPLKTADDDVPPFGRLYDATEKYQRKGDMAPLSPTDFNKGDIVLVEFSVCRWASKKKNDTDQNNGDEKGKAADKPKQYKRKEWKEWGIDLRLEAMSLLFQGSEFYNELKPDEDFSA